MLVGSVVPRPIGWASTLSKTGVANLAPFSFFTVVCVVPPMISLTIARNPDGSEKHTLKNIRDTGEFCFNVVTQPVWKEMVDSANGFPEGDTEFEKTGLTPIPCVKIKAPRVKEVPIHFECKLERVLELGPNRHPLVIGEVIYMHVDPACMTGKYIDMRKLDPIGRLNGFFYSHASAKFSSGSSTTASRARSTTDHESFDAVITAVAIVAVVMGFSSACCAASPPSSAI